MLKQDLARRYNSTQGSRFSRILECYRSPGVHAVVVFRFGRWMLRQPFPARIALKPVYLLLNHRMMAKWGIQLDVEAKIGGGFLIHHYGGIFVGSGATIGENVTISHNVTIGLAGESTRRGTPVIGNNVYIAPGANISGKIRIGDNVKIGANTVVNRSIPDSTLVQLPKMQVVNFPIYGDGSSSAPGEES